MIELFTAATPNGQKIHIMLEETRLPYRETWVDIEAGDQFAPAFLKISPNNKIPAIVDDDGPDGRRISLFESGAILLYLARKSGRFLPDDSANQWETLQWLFWGVASFSPMLGQAHHFNAYAPMRPDGPVVLPYAQKRYTNEASRLYGVLDRRLNGREYVAADSFTIADITLFPWCRLHRRQGLSLQDFPNVSEWFARIASRPAVAKDMARLEDIVTGFTKESWDTSFGRRQTNIE